MPFPLAVVIPTFNRCDALRTCLQHLEEQTWKDFEVVVVDDGSTDRTTAWIEGYRQNTPLRLRYLRQENSGPARARNVAVSAIDAAVTLLIGDDIFPSPDFVATHLQLHRERPEQSVVGLGLTVWAEQGQRITKFMRWLDRDGMQFHYGELLAGAVPDWRHFYTSNLSLKTSLLRAFPFDESFPYAAMEDIEIACRIDHQHGLEMVFLPEATAEHLHPMTFAGACRRIEKVGESSAYFDRLWPDRLPRAEKSVIFRTGEVAARIPGAMRLLEWLAGSLTEVACPNRLMTFVLNYYFEQGYQRGDAAKPPLR